MECGNAGQPRSTSATTPTSAARRRESSTLELTIAFGRGVSMPRDRALGGADGASAPTAAPPIPSSAASRRCEAVTSRAYQGVRRSRRTCTTAQTASRSHSSYRWRPMSGDRLHLIVAHDEALARKLVRQYAGAFPDIEVVCECADTTALEAALERGQADAALLDIRMPGRDVFDVLADAAQRGRIPALIFATAYDRYAVRAFDINAVDYLVKPFSESRFAEALARLRERRRSGVDAGNLPRLLRDLGRRPDRLLVPEGTRIVPLLVSSIAWINAEGDYARIHSGGKSYLVYRTLNDLEERLDPADFLRVHRSAIIRVDQIAEVKPADSGRHQLTLKDGTRLIVSRGRGAALKPLFL